MTSKSPEDALTAPSKPKARVTTSSSGYLKSTASTSNKSSAPSSSRTNNPSSKPPSKPFPYSRDTRPSGATSHAATKSTAAKPTSHRSGGTDKLPPSKPKDAKSAPSTTGGGAGTAAKPSASTTSSSSHSTLKSSLDKSEKDVAQKVDASLHSSRQSSVSGSVSNKAKEPHPSQLIQTVPSPPSITSAPTLVSRAPVATMSRPSDSLQVAAQACSWIYVNASLEHGLSAAQVNAQETLNAFSQQLIAQEAGIADHKLRSEAENLISFFDDLLVVSKSTDGDPSEKTDRDLRNAKAVQNYIQHESAWEALEIVILQLAARTLSGQSESGSALSGDQLADAYAESCKLLDQVRDTTNALTSLRNELDALPLGRESSKAAQVTSQLVAVLDARSENVIIGEDILVRARENLRASIQLESIHMSLSGDLVS
ncbi:uncharacterized protein STEHIDRAFT_112190 [Stereum hirsutum FP-91666 SS1]|uniref:uncharacterized protein n=1 Tax=Stereum hirsutum (strain FP-91666) TaxID=721885 RepID=UPI0004449A7D|nr:uncharacterized protein STEHIDRAFT_112190 [Stereum hirsutum FP-91666 SS1]EIM85675.1 hypothetical protein STEHIDRAFT_112190 [Stereum hirsutum FP-91666 SS1]